jgi:hypothetical protein
MLYTMLKRGMLHVHVFWFAAESCAYFTGSVVRVNGHITYRGEIEKMDRMLVNLVKFFSSNSQFIHHSVRLDLGLDET